jgi:hypothetical protein
LAFIIHNTRILELAGCCPVDVEDVGFHRKDGQTMNKKVVRCCACGKELRYGKAGSVEHRCSGRWAKWRLTRGKENV